MDDPRDILAKMKADADQAVEGTREFARMTASYYKELIEEGVPASLAEQLTVTYTSSFLIAAAGAQGEGGEE